MTTPLHVVRLAEGTPPAVSFVVLGAPVSLNHAFPQGLHGRRYPSREYATWKRSIAASALAGSVRLLEGPVRVELRIVFPSCRPDLDNAVKPILDALTGVAWRDDRQVAEILAVKGHDPERPRVEVRVEALEEQRGREDRIKAAIAGYLGGGR